ncbi:hypothetical protein GCM10017776_53900 [Streptomyces griseoluteus]|nr:hypothetical protein GCM10017776_53900 [Streptomyces griseoluteus]
MPGARHPVPARPSRAFTTSPTCGFTPVGVGSQCAAPGCVPGAFPVRKRVKCDMSIRLVEKAAA